jgi:hypothetical protein
MKVITSPEFIWAEASLRLPERMLPALKRWVALGTVAGDEHARVSRAAGGRI